MRPCGTARGPCQKEGRWGQGHALTTVRPLLWVGRLGPCVSPGSPEEPDLQEAGGRTGVDRGVDRDQWIRFRASARVAVGLAGRKSEGQTCGMDA